LGLSRDFGIQTGYSVRELQDGHSSSSCTYYYSICRREKESKSQCVALISQPLLHRSARTGRATPAEHELKRDNR